LRPCLATAHQMDRPAHQRGLLSRHSARLYFATIISAGVLGAATTHILGGTVTVRSGSRSSRSKRQPLTGLCRSAFPYGRCGALGDHSRRTRYGARRGAASVDLQLRSKRRPCSPRQSLRRAAGRRTNGYELSRRRKTRERGCYRSQSCGRPRTQGRREDGILDDRPRAWPPSRTDNCAMGAGVTIAWSRAHGGKLNTKGE
jgi:hypothetical protein